MKKLLSTFFVLCVLSFLSACYYQHHHLDAGNSDDEQVSDSIEFAEKHHYSVGYNFVVQVDTLSLCTEIPSRAQMLSVMPDSVLVFKNDELIVAETAIVQEDETDSVWIKVARDQRTQGWVREKSLLPSVSPDDPISIAIFKFSGNHVWGTLVLVGVLMVIFIFRFLYVFCGKAKNARGSKMFTLVFPRLIFSPYPTLLRLTLSGAAVLYSSIQLFAPYVWEGFYFDPTLNPFAVSPLLGAFLFTCWLILVFFIATVDDCLRQLSFFKSLLYIFVTITSLAILYLFFSLATLIYAGYPLFVLFLLYSVWHYIKKIRPRYHCGHCGAPLHDKGCCPFCGVNNE